MKRWFLALIAVNLAGIITLAFVYPDPMLAPGALIPGHAGLATNCFACHAPLRGAVEARCTTCHTITNIGLRTVSGAPIVHGKPIAPFHQGLARTDCMGCHTDHPPASLTPPHSHTFAHAMLKPASAAKCSTCHTAPTTAVHVGITRQCSACNTQANWSAASIDHARFFVLDGPHDVACSTCHTRANDFSTFTCYGCHEHKEAPLVRKHLEEGIRNIDNCVTCHRSADAEGGEGNEGGEGGDD